MWNVTKLKKNLILIYWHWKGVYWLFLADYPAFEKPASVH